jgi:hypothetical protein
MALRNKQLFIDKMNRIDGKLKTIRVMSTRQGTTVQDIHKLLDEVEELMTDLEDMVEREETVYGR